MTKKLFYEDPYIKEFSATIKDINRIHDGTVSLVLDQTAFYPEGGGQPWDLGEIDGCKVVSVVEQDDQLNHILKTSDLGKFTIGQTINGCIDWPRRFDHMQQHTGQHILSAAFEHLFAIETVGFHMGQEFVTIDLSMEDWNEHMIEDAETLANQIVFENRDVSAKFVTFEELSKLPLRKQPTVNENIRIVTIPNFDYNPCGGTHPNRTGEVGSIKVLGYEKIRGNVRLEFVCGMRAICQMREKQMLLRQASQLLTCGERELPKNLGRLLSERKELDKALQDAKSKLLQIEADKLLTDASTMELIGVQYISACYSDKTMQELQKLAQLVITQAALCICFLAVANHDRIQLVFARGKEVEADMNQLVKDTLQLIHGKGGGSAALAQGSGEATLSISELFSFARNRLVVVD